MAVNKSCCPSNAAECLFLLFLSKISATAEQRYQGGTVVLLQAKGGLATPNMGSPTEMCLV